MMGDEDDGWVNRCVDSACLLAYVFVCVYLFVCLFVVVMCLCMCVNNGVDSICFCM